MKEKNTNIFRRIAILVLGIVAFLSLVFMAITFFTNKHYQQASIQLLNKDLAAHIARFTSPFTEGGINHRKADSVFYNAMVLCPSAEVYFLDTAGHVMDYYNNETKIQQWNVPLNNIKEYISTRGEKYIKADDPRDAGTQKIFSAAEVMGETGRLGYIYVILASQKSEGIVQGLLGNQITNLALLAFAAVLLLSGLFSLLYLRRLQANYGQLVGVLQRFEAGDYTARFPTKKNHEFSLITQSFNRLADLLSSSISKLRVSEAERKAFLATVSHDLRTPLAIARGYTETLMLRRETGDITIEDQRHFSQLIYAKMLQIENMVKQLYELSKMEAVEFKPTREPFVLSEIVQETVNTFQQMAKEKNVNLKCAQCQYHVWINADIGMMERVVQNLVDNALKNTPEDGIIALALSVKKQELIFKIENTSEPLSPELLQWINERLEDGDDYAKRPAKTGLGLIIVKKILSLHHFPLKALSEEGQTVFTFSMPVYKH